MTWLRELFSHAKMHVAVRNEPNPPTPPSGTTCTMTLLSPVSWGRASSCMALPDRRSTPSSQGVIQQFIRDGSIGIGEAYMEVGAVARLCTRLSESCLSESAYSKLARLHLRSSLAFRDTGRRSPTPPMASN